MWASGAGGGDKKPSQDEVAANLRAGAPSTRQRALPDVDAWADFKAAPELVHERLSVRSQEGRCPSAANAFPVPKPGSDEVRRVAWLNPLDELHFRILVGRVASIIDGALGSDVFSYRLQTDPPGWSVLSGSKPFMLRTERGEALFADGRCNAMGIADIRHCYPSIRLSVLSETLGRRGLPDEAIARIVDFLAPLVDMGAPPGLPVDLDASGLLANAVLLGLDEALAGCVLGHVRFSDDSWLYLPSADDWPAVLDVYSGAAATLGLEVNESKAEVHPKGSGGAEHAMRHGHIAYLVSGAGGHRAPEAIAEDLARQLDQEDPDWHVVRFHLGQLGSNPQGLQVLDDYSSIWDQVPINVGHYMMAVANDKKSRRRIDADQLIEQATGSHSSRSLAGQLHACRVASHIRLGKEHGKQLEDLATRDSLRQHPPLRAWAARAWGSSEAHSPKRAVEYACHFGDFSVRRAFALTIKPTSSTPANRSCWRRKLGSVDADLEPTLARLS